MDVVFAIAALLALAASAGCAGFLFAERNAREKDAAGRHDTSVELRGVLKTISGEHNRLVQQVSDLADRIGVVDIKASGALGKSPAMRPVRPGSSQT